MEDSLSAVLWVEEWEEAGSGVGWTKEMTAPAVREGLLAGMMDGDLWNLAGEASWTSVVVGLAAASQHYSAVFDLRLDLRCSWHSFEPVQH